MVYYGNCHCGRYRFELVVDSDGLKRAASCSCLDCVKLGAIWLALADRRLTATRDEGRLARHRSSSVEYEHDETQRAVNIRSLRGINAFDYDERQTVGEASQEVALPTKGECLCGSVRVELLAPFNLKDVTVKEDNCSICTRNAWIGVYPPKSQVIIKGAEHMQDYVFGRGFTGHPFCKTCGVHVGMNVYGPPTSIVDRLPEHKKALVMKNLDVSPVNVRVLDGIGAVLDSLYIARSDEGTDGYERDVLHLV